MLTRNLTILLASAVLINVSACINEAKANGIPKFIVLEMTGDVATEYANLTRPTKRDEMR